MIDRGLAYAKAAAAAARARARARRSRRRRCSRSASTSPSSSVINIAGSSSPRRASPSSPSSPCRPALRDVRGACHHGLPRRSTWSPRSAKRRGPRDHPHRHGVGSLSAARRHLLEFFAGRPLQDDVARRLPPDARLRHHDRAFAALPFYLSGYKFEGFKAAEGGSRPSR